MVAGRRAAVAWLPAVLPCPPAPRYQEQRPDLSRHGRIRSVDFGMPERQGLPDLSRTSLEVQAR